MPKYGNFASQNNAYGKAVTGSIDTGLEFYRQVLDLRAYRQQILTADIANASTPGFKALDVDFQEALNTVTAAPSSRADPESAGTVWLVDDPRAPRPAASGLSEKVAASVKYQVGAPVTLDGNSVDLDQEKLAAAENAVEYEAAASFTSQIIRMLTIAINGSAPQSSGA